MTQYRISLQNKEWVLERRLKNKWQTVSTHTSKYRAFITFVRSNTIGITEFLVWAENKAAVKKE